MIVTIYMHIYIYAHMNIQLHRYKNVWVDTPTCSCVVCFSVLECPEHLLTPSHDMGPRTEHRTFTAVISWHKLKLYENLIGLVLSPSFSSYRSLSVNLKALVQVAVENKNQSTGDPIFPNLKSIQPTLIFNNIHVNPGLRNHSLLSFGGYSPNSDNMIRNNGTRLIKQPFGGYESRSHIFSKAICWSKSSSAQQLQLLASCWQITCCGFCRNASWKFLA